MGTSEENWFKNSKIKGKDYIEIDEQDLDLILTGKEDEINKQEDNLFNLMIID